MVTNSFEVGFHTITLVVSDEQAVGSDTLLVEIITLGDAVDELYGVLIESEIDRKHKRPLLATLERVWESFEDGRLKAGVRQLRAFQLKVRAQVSPKHSALGRRLIGASQQIIDAVEFYLEANEETPDDDKGKGGRP